MTARRGGGEAADQLQFFKDYQGRILSNVRYNALPIVAKGVFLHLRMVAANTGRDGAIRLAGTHDVPAVFRELVGLVQGLMGGGTTREQARECLESIVEAKVLVRDRRQVVWVANAEEEWARWGYSDSPAARRQRESRGRRDGGEGEDVTDSGAARPGGRACPPRTESIEPTNNDGPKRTRTMNEAVTSSVTSLPIQIRSDSDSEEDETRNQIGTDAEQAEAEELKQPMPTRSGQARPPGRALSGHESVDREFYATPPVELWCRLTQEHCDITKRTARKYFRLLGSELFYGVCAELRDDVLAGLVVHPGKVGSQKLVDAWAVVEKRQKRPFGFAGGGSVPIPPQGGTPTGRPMADVFGQAGGYADAEARAMDAGRNAAAVGPAASSAAYGQVLSDGYATVRAAILADLGVGLRAAEKVSGIGPTGVCFKQIGGG